MFRWILLSIAIGVSAGCADLPTRIVVAPPPLGQRFEHEVLDVPINEIVLDRVPIREAVDQIAAEVHRIYHNDVYFQVVIEFSHFRGASFSHLPNTPIGADDLNLAGPRISIRATNLSVREALTQICRQAGWSYQQLNVNQIMFRDGPPLSQEKAVGRDGHPWYPPEVR